ncbi:MAG: ATP-binding cassette domain-containing protein [Candidatus Gracilibacteria bacterium]|nr:ATP-binding cassette domain-containing protein [Candidatus Gracilibacteria bacterium]
MASNNETVIKFSSVFFEYVHPKLILEDVTFNVRAGKKITIMGQNGAGKSTIFKLITKEIEPKIGKVHTPDSSTIAIAFQVMPVEDKELTVQQYFKKYKKALEEENIDKEISEVLRAVNLKTDLEKIIDKFSGGQQARLLLAAALIQKPDILLLDEPTNNLDKEGIYHLEDFLKEYKNTVLVISHDAEFLNSFTDGVLYLDVHTKIVEQYVGNYYDVIEQVSKKIEKENMHNARMKKEAQDKMDQANVFAHKGGKLRAVAKKMKSDAEALKENMGDKRREDKAIAPFTIEIQENIGGEILKIDTIGVVENNEMTQKPVGKILRKDSHMLLSAPNGMGKSTFLNALTSGKVEGCTIGENVKIGYYTQDFHNMNFENTVYEELRKSGPGLTEQEFRSQAARFLIDGELMKAQVGHISEGQKGLVAFCALVFQKPGLLILDEPTNHINFRHIPIIAEALNNYKGAMILVSHVDEFVWSIRMDEYLDLDQL